VIYYPLFSEGWALYGESPLLALETDVYKNNPLQKYGMLKWQIWRAIRLIVDTGLHYKGKVENSFTGLATNLFERQLQHWQVFLIVPNP